MRLDEMNACSDDTGAFETASAEDDLSAFKRACEGHETAVAGASTVEEAQALEGDHDTEMADFTGRMSGHQDRMTGSHMCPKSHMKDEGPDDGDAH